ncbi:MAG: hypothetical protein CL908_15830 [Deltaproteobacteria bacterium]|nr:hypothetical protein [Deltaproteobacteria bacterium]
MPITTRPPDAHDLAARVRSGGCSARELVCEAIARIEAHDDLLNAVIHRRFDAALDEVAQVDPEAQPFAGVPILLKDSGCTIAGEPHHRGLSVLRDANHRAAATAWLVDRLRAAGFVILGRTNVPELTSLPTTEPAAYGPSRNPWSLEHSTGGSSGGSGAAVAGGLVPIAHASDGGGSTRMPASCCGLVGLKPSRGRLTRGPREGLGWGGLSIDGFLSRSVRDSAAVLEHTMGPGPGDPETAPGLPIGLIDALSADPASLRVGLRTEGFVDADPTHPEIVRAVDRCAQTLAEMGHRVEPGGPSELDDESIPAAQGVVIATAQALVIEQLEAAIGREIGLDELEPVNAQSVLAGRAQSALEHARAIDRLHAYSRRVSTWWEDHDLLLMPTITGVPPRLGTIRGDASPEELLGMRRRYGWLTPPWNITGQPAISLPIGWSEGGLPLGVQLVAALGREDLLLSVAARLEEAFDWPERRPPHGALATTES